jgi:hypothetical protein
VGVFARRLASEVGENGGREMTDSRIIIAGDSNPLGYLNNGPAPYTLTARVQIWTDTNGDGQADAWNYMRPGVNTGTAKNPFAWGPEVQIANRWLNDNPEGYLWIVKNAETVKGGSTLANDWNPDDGGMYESATRTINAAMHNLDGGQFAFSEYDAAFVGLGENDAAGHDMAQDYYANIVEFNDSARDDWHVTQLVEYRITNGAGKPEDNLAVRNAQWQADQLDPHLVTFKTQGFAMLPDGIHYAAAGQIAMGDAAYDGWML